MTDRDIVDGLYRARAGDDFLGDEELLADAATHVGVAVRRGRVGGVEVLSERRGPFGQGLERRRLATDADDGLGRDSVTAARLVPPVVPQKHGGGWRAQEPALSHIGETDAVQGEDEMERKEKARTRVSDQKANARISARRTKTRDRVLTLPAAHDQARYT